MSSFPTLLNVTMTDADTEYSQELPTGTKQFSCATVDGTAFRIAFVTGKVATPTAPYWAILANQQYESPDLTGQATITLYAGCGSGSKVLQIVAWQ